MTELRARIDEEGPIFRVYHPLHSRLYGQFIVQGPTGRPKIFTISRSSHVVDYSTSQDGALKKARKLASDLASKANREYEGMVMFRQSRETQTSV